jgi:hypothetical protein
VPGTLAQTLVQQSRVLVIDDIQHLRTDEATSLLGPLLLGPTALGRVVVVGRDPLSAAVGAAIAEIELHGLDVEASETLWAALEESFGPVAACRSGFVVNTRGSGSAHRRGISPRSTRRHAPLSKPSRSCVHRWLRPPSRRWRRESISRPR